MKKILITFGTRPEAIKMAPLINELKNHKDTFDVRIGVTGQHHTLLEQVLDFFEIVPHYNLKLMKDRQDLSELSASILVEMKKVLADFKPDYLFVHGDTTSSTFAAIAGFYAGVKICHVEAGLRTHQLNVPFPEEANRQLTARLAWLHFAPTVLAKNNLISEGINPSQIFVTGNTIIDALLYANEKIKQLKHEPIQQLKTLINANKPTILVTCHRRENFGEGFEQICKALKHIVLNNDVQVVYPLHLNPNIRDSVMEMLGDINNIMLTEPLDYPSFIWLMNTASFIITDSGGVQEEGTALGKFILLMRAYTERPEVVDLGQVKLVDSNFNMIVAAAEKALSKGDDLKPNSIDEGPYGKGNAAKLIVQLMLDHNV